MGPLLDTGTLTPVLIEIFHRLRRGENRRFAREAIVLVVAPIVEDRGRTQKIIMLWFHTPSIAKRTEPGR